MAFDGGYTPDPRFGSYGGAPVQVPDPRDQHIAFLTSELGAARAEVKKLKRVVLRANIAGGIVLALWVIGFAVQFSQVMARV